MLGLRFSHIYFLAVVLALGVVGMLQVGAIAPDQNVAPTVTVTETELVPVTVTEPYLITSTEYIPQSLYVTTRLYVTQTNIQTDFSSLTFAQTVLSTHTQEKTITAEAPPLLGFPVSQWPYLVGGLSIVTLGLVQF